MANEVRTDFIIDEKDSPRKVHNFKDSLIELNTEMDNLGKNSTFAKDFTAHFDKLHSQTNKLQTNFADIAKTRLDSGQVDKLTRDAVRGSEKARSLALNIVEIKKELASPNRTSSIAFLTEELKGAEREADSLKRRLDALPNGGGAGAVGAAEDAAEGGGATRGRIGRIRGFGAIFRAADLGFNEMELNAGIAGLELLDKKLTAARAAKAALTATSGVATTATTAEAAAQAALAGTTTTATTAATAQTAALGAEAAAADTAAASIMGISTATLATIAPFAALAAAGIAAFEISKNIREEAERRLHVEEQIAGAINKQIIGQKEALASLQESREQADYERRFNKFAETADVDSLKRQLATYDKLKDLIPAKIGDKDNPDFAANSQKIHELESLISQTQDRNTKNADDAFNKRFANYEKEHEQALKFEKKRAEEAEKKEKQREAAAKKAEELERQYLSTFDNLFAKANAQNPFVKVFTDASKAMLDLKKNLKDLPIELQAQASAMQQKINLRQLLETEANSKLSIFSLRNDAENFRNPFDGNKQKKEQEEFLIRFFQNNPNYAFLNNIDPSTKIKDLDLEARNKILKTYGASSLTETPADRFNKKLDEQYNLLYKPGQSAEQQAIADRKFISLTQGVNPVDLTSSGREEAGAARERDAARQEKHFKDAYDQRKDLNEIATKIEENTAKSADGKQEPHQLNVRVQDEREGTRTELKKAPTSADTDAAYYDPNLGFSTGSGFSNR